MDGGIVFLVSEKGSDIELVVVVSGRLIVLVPIDVGVECVEANSIDGVDGLKSACCCSWYPHIPHLVTVCRRSIGVILKRMASLDAQWVESAMSGVPHHLLSTIVGVVSQGRRMIQERTRASA